MLSSTDHEILKKCIRAGCLPEVLRRSDVEMEITSRRAEGAYQFVNRETGEVVTRKEMKAAGGAERKVIEVHREEPMQPYFERDIERDIVICPMRQTLYYAGPGYPSGEKDPSIRRYHRAAACNKCQNKCTTAKHRLISFKPGQLRVPCTFYDRCKAGKITQRMNHKFIAMRPAENCVYDEWVTIRFYPNQHKLRKRNEIVEHPYGTVKWWNDGRFLLLKGKLKASAEMALAFLGYNFKRALNLLGTDALLTLINA